MEKSEIFYCQKCSYSSTRKINFTVHRKLRHRKIGKRSQNISQGSVSLGTSEKAESLQTANVDVKSYTETIEIDLQFGSSNEIISADSTKIFSTENPNGEQGCDIENFQAVTKRKLSTSQYANCNNPPGALAQKLKWAQEPSDTEVLEEHKVKCQKLDDGSVWTPQTKAVRARTEESPYECTQCSCTSTYQQNFKRHLTIHSVERRYKCRYCEYRSNHLPTIKGHERIHTDGKLYKCQYCDYVKNHLPALRRHEMTHTGEKPHKCQYCDFKSIQVGNLREHELIHTGDKPFKCTCCEYKARRERILKEHMLQKHRVYEKEPLRCNVCEYVTFSKYQMGKHSRRRHEN